MLGIELPAKKQNKNLSAKIGGQTLTAKSWRPNSGGQILALIAQETGTRTSSSPRMVTSWISVGLVWPGLPSVGESTR